MNQQAPLAQFSSPGASNVAPAGFWIRFLAALIDGIIIGVVSLPVKLVAIALFKSHPGFGTFINVIISCIITGYYYGYFYSVKGATPGKQALGLRVVNARTGGNVTFKTAVIRDLLGKFVSMIILGVGFIMAGFRADKRALHDLMANTQVVKIS